MKRTLWGEFEDGSDKKHETKPDEIILPSRKVEKLKQLKQIFQHAEKKEVQIKPKNPLVTQTVEVMNQTEMLQDLIDTYASKSGLNNYLPNACQVIPEVNFPQENTADLVKEDKFIKPLWFIPPIETKFSKGVPKNYDEVRKDIARAAIRKSISGLLRVAGFTEATHSSLVLYTDAVEEFLRNFLTQVKDVQVNENKEKQNDLDVLILEKGYYALTQNSLTSLHNYYKNDIIARNRTEIDEFKEIYSDYEKLMKESQNMQRETFIKEEDFMNLFEFPGTIANVSQQADVGNVNITTMPETEYSNTGTFKDIFDGEMETTAAPDEQMNFLRDLQQWNKLS